MSHTLLISNDVASAADTRNVLNTAAWSLINTNRDLASFPKRQGSSSHLRLVINNRVEQSRPRAIAQTPVNYGTRGPEAQQVRGDRSILAPQSDPWILFGLYDATQACSAYRTARQHSHGSCSLHLAVMDLWYESRLFHDGAV